MEAKQSCGVAGFPRWKLTLRPANRALVLPAPSLAESSAGWALFECAGREPPFSSPPLRRAIRRHAQRLQPHLASILHPPAAQHGNRPNRSPGAQNGALPRQAIALAIGFEVHVAALLLARPIAFQ